MTIIFIAIIVLIIWWNISKRRDGTLQKIRHHEEYAKAKFQEYQNGCPCTENTGKKDDLDVLKMKDWYVRLKEKYKHSPAQLGQLSEDWANYASNLETQERITHYMFFHNTYDSDDQINEKYNQGKEVFLKNQEIENRFAEMLGSDYKKQLEKERGDKKTTV